MKTAIIKQQKKKWRLMYRTDAGKLAILKRGNASVDGGGYESRRDAIVAMREWNNKR